MGTPNVNTDKVKVTAGSVVGGIIMFLTTAFVLSIVVFTATQGYGYWLVPNSGVAEFYLSEVATRVLSMTVALLALIVGVFIGLGISRNFGFDEVGADKDEKS